MTAKHYGPFRLIARLVASRNNEDFIKCDSCNEGATRAVEMRTISTTGGGKGRPGKIYAYLCDKHFDEKVGE
jgi:hypothetical protein